MSLIRSWRASRFGKETKGIGMFVWCPGSNGKIFHAVSGLTEV